MDQHITVKIPTKYKSLFDKVMESYRIPYEEVEQYHPDDTVDLSLYSPVRGGCQ